MPLRTSIRCTNDVFLRMGFATLGRKRVQSQQMSQQVFAPIQLGQRTQILQVKTNKRSLVELDNPVKIFGKPVNWKVLVLCQEFEENEI